MNSDRRFEHDLPDLLADLYLGPTPNYRDDIVQLVARTPQRPAWMSPERWLPMSVISLARQNLRPLPWRTIGLLAVLALVIASLVAVYVGSTTQLPAPFGPARNGLLAYEAGGDIVVLDQGTGTTRVVVGGPTVDTAPAFSRDGTRLAFLRNAGLTSEVWVSNSSGGDIRRLAAGLEPLEFEAGANPWSSMEWAPDGRAILLSIRSDLGRSMTIVSSDGTTPVRTLDVGMRAEGPTWRPPDGGEILFRGVTSAGYGLYAVRADGSGLREVAKPTSAEYDHLFFGWSPDGARLVYQQIQPLGPRLLYVVGADGRNPIAVTNTESVGGQWSPEGLRIAFHDASGADVVILSVAQADGSGQRGIPGSYDGSAQWAPDGQSILQMSQTGGGAVLLDPDGGPAVSLSGLAGGWPAWQRLAP